MSSRRNEPTIERVVDAALSMPPSIELAPLLFEILTGFVSAQMFTANFNSATSASHGVTCKKTCANADRESVRCLIGARNRIFFPSFTTTCKTEEILAFLSYSVHCCKIMPIKTDLAILSNEINLAEALEMIQQLLLSY